MKTLVMSLLLLVGLSAHSESPSINDGSKLTLKNGATLNVIVERATNGVAQGIRLVTSEGDSLSQVNVGCDNTHLNRSPENTQRSAVDVISKIAGMSCTALYTQNILGTAEPQLIGESNLNPIKHCIRHAQTVINNLEAGGLSCSFNLDEASLTDSIY